MLRLFGTDGVRGVANRTLMPELAFQMGRAAGAYFGKSGERPRFLIGRDTRISGPMLEAALAAGLCAAGVDVDILGVIPTPGVAYLTKKHGYDAGVVISASHNPFPDNGIKFFNAKGHKLSDAAEEEIEELLQKGDEGATSTVLPDILARLGATVIATACEPDGVNINADCGSTHIEHLAKKVVACGADCGIANDGDADRCLFVDETGRVVDGDHLMLINALVMKEEGRLASDTVVGTVMSNLGFSRALAEHGLQTVATKVGDRYVLEEMLAHGYSIGGEQSGHIIFSEFNTTGDGQITAVQTLAALKKSGGKLSQLADLMKDYPQILENVRVYSKTGWEEKQEITEAIRAGEEELGANGRILVRASGTEPLIRVMAEGPDTEQLSRIVSDIVQVIRQEIGEEG